MAEAVQESEGEEVMLLLPAGVREASSLSRQKNEIEIELRQLAGEWDGLPYDDCDPTEERCLDCHRLIGIGKRDAVVPALVNRYGTNANRIHAVRFRCRGGCKPRGEK